MHLLSFLSWDIYLSWISVPQAFRLGLELIALVLSFSGLPACGWQIRPWDFSVSVMM